MESCPQPESETMEYWKKQAQHYEQKVNEIQQELDEYTENSAQLEKELEASLVQIEKQNSDLENQNKRLKHEIEMLRNKLDRSQQETNALECELQGLKIDKEKQADYIRELEQKNDDLERGQRVITESVSYIEALWNQACERNAVLESEVDEVENLRVKLQRATDEARDLKQELKVVERIDIHKKEDIGPNESMAPVTNGHISNQMRSQVETETQTLLATPQKREINGNAMTPSSRVTAINLVGDLLRKVGLERFLCRECGKVKCSCNEAVAAATATTTSTAQADSSDADTHNNIDSEFVTYRKPINPSLPLSVHRVFDKEPDSQLNLTQRHSESRFVRSGQGDGKLRRSFAVRSREGIENLLGFSRKTQDLTKSNTIVRK